MKEKIKKLKEDILNKNLEGVATFLAHTPLHQIEQMKNNLNVEDRLFIEDHRDKIKQLALKYL